MNISGQGFTYYPPGGGGGGSEWYAPIGTTPAVLPTAAGSDALAAGNGSVGSGFRAVAIGYAPTSSNNFTVAIGSAATANNSSCIAIGQLASATGILSLAIGSTANSGYQYSVAVGYGATNYGDESIAIGRNANTQTSGISIGRDCNSSLNGIAVGYQATCQYGTYGVALGYQSTVGTTYGIALGTNSNAAATASVAWQFATTINAYEHQVKRVGGGRRMECQDGATTTDGAATPIGTFAYPNNSACGFVGVISAYRTVTTGGGIVGDSASWQVTGLLKSVGGTSTLIGVAVGVGGAPNYNDAGAAGWTVVAAIGSGGIVFSATGQAGETIRWESSIQFTTTG